ncbi:MAG: leucyl aminopeptidase family protein [Phycisphaeraceae bacterium]
MYSEIKLAPRSSRAKPDAIAVFVFDKAKQLPEGYRPLDERVGGALAEAIKRTEFSAALGVVSTLYPMQGPQRVFVCGLGDPAQFDGNALRAAAAKLTRTASGAGVRRLQLAVMPGVGYRLAPDQVGAAVGDGFAIAQFEFDQFKGAAAKAQKQEETNKTPELTLEVANELRDAVDEALAVGQAVSTARRLAATPPNVADPVQVVQEARQMAQRTGLKCSVIDEKKAKELGMGGLVAVGGGGSKPPALICLEWKGSRQRSRGKKTASRSGGNQGGSASGGASGGQGPVMLVGKAITFDTGGYSLKPGGGRDMKYDKCGGMTVLGAMEAVALLKLPIHVVGLVPVAENMIDEDAYRVDDILTMHNGVTVEVTNTDAEGRLILGDALAYGTKRYKPRAVIDLATLTGGVVVALGSFCAGVFCNDDDLRERLQRASDFTGEKIWPLPLWEEHRGLLKSNHADIVNAGEREAHPIQGAAFLSYFVGSEGPKGLPTIPWAHFDIAGVAALKKANNLYPEGPTGYGVRLLTRLLGAWEQ